MIQKAHPKELGTLYETRQLDLYIYAFLEFL